MDATFKISEKYSCPITEIPPSELTRASFIPGQVYPLAQAWEKLPGLLKTQLAPLQGRSGLALAYQPAFVRAPERWQIFRLSDAVPSTNSSSDTAAGQVSRGGPPQGQPSLDFSFGSILLGTGIVIAIDLGVRKAFPEMSPPARSVVATSAVFGLHRLLAPQSSLRSLARQMPIFYSLNLMSALALNQLGSWAGVEELTFGHAGHDWGSLASMILLQQTLTHSKYAAVLHGGARLSSSTWLHSLKNPAGTAGWTGGFGQALKVVGVFGWANLGLGALDWAYLRICGLDRDPESRLDILAEQVQRQQALRQAYGTHGGAMVDLVLGNLVQFGVRAWSGAASAVQGSLDYYRNEASPFTVRDSLDWSREKIKGALIRSSREFGQWLEARLTWAIAEAWDDVSGKVDWPKANESLQRAYQELGPDEIRNIYSLLEYTETWAPEAAKLAGLVTLKGEILSIHRRELQAVAKASSLKFAKRSEEELGSRLAAFNFSQGLSSRALLAPGYFQESQKEQLPEILRLAEEQKYFEGVAEKLE